MRNYWTVVNRIIIRFTHFLVMLCLCEPAVVLGKQRLCQDVSTTHVPADDALSFPGAVELQLCLLQEGPVSHLHTSRLGQPCPFKEGTSDAPVSL